MCAFPQSVIVEVNTEFPRLTLNTQVILNYVQAAQFGHKSFPTDRKRRVEQTGRSGPQSGSQNIWILY